MSKGASWRRVWAERVRPGGRRPSMSTWRVPGRCPGMAMPESARAPVLCQDSIVCESGLPGRLRRERPPRAEGGHDRLPGSGDAEPAPLRHPRRGQLGQSAPGGRHRLPEGGEPRPTSAARSSAASTSTTTSAVASPSRGRLWAARRPQGDHWHRHAGHHPSLVQGGSWHASTTAASTAAPGRPRVGTVDVADLVDADRLRESTVRLHSNP